MDPGWTAEVGEGQSQGKFFVSEATGSRLRLEGGGRRSEKEEAEGKFFPGWRVEVSRRRSEVDEKERKNFFLGMPAMPLLCNGVLLDHFNCCDHVA